MGPLALLTQTKDSPYGDPQCLHVSRCPPSSPTQGTSPAWTSCSCCLSCFLALEGRGACCHSKHLMKFQRPLGDVFWDLESHLGPDTLQLAGPPPVQGSPFLLPETSAGSQALSSKADSCGNRRARFRVGPFNAHGLTTPVPTWPQIPLCSPGRGARRGLKWG